MTTIWGLQKSYFLIWLTVFKDTMISRYLKYCMLPKSDFLLSRLGKKKWNISIVCIAQKRTEKWKKYKINCREEKRDVDIKWEKREKMKKILNNLILPEQHLCTSEEFLGEYVEAHNILMVCWLLLCYAKAECDL